MDICIPLYRQALSRQSLHVSSSIQSSKLDTGVHVLPVWGAAGGGAVTGADLSVPLGKELQYALFPVLRLPADRRPGNGHHPPLFPGKQRQIPACVPVSEKILEAGGNQFPVHPGAVYPQFRVLDHPAENGAGGYLRVLPEL